ncbi:MAG: thermonuclease family protein [Actinomycetota bacterium]
MPIVSKFFRATFTVACTMLVLSSCAGSDEPLSPGASGRVVDIVDGDTLDVRIDGRVERVRLIGIDTPETKKPGSPVECFGPEATARLAQLLPPGTEIVVERDIEPRDDYGRLLLYVFRFDDTLFVNSDLIRQGFARPLEIAPNTTYAREFRRLAGLAESEKIGLWKACSVIP